MSDDQFTKMFKYMQDEFKSIRKEIEASRGEHGQILSALDAYSKKVVDLEQEHTLLSHQVNKHQEILKA